MEVKTLININEIQELVKKYPDVVHAETMAVMKIIVARLEKEVTEGTPAGVGGAAGLRGSIYGEVVSMAGSSVEGVVGTPLEYGEVVEMGRRPGKGFPPIAPITLWAIRKLGVADKEAKSVAFLIARKIAKKGFEGAHMFQKAWDKNERWVMDQLQTIPGRVVDRL